MQLDGPETRRPNALHDVLVVGDSLAASAGEQLERHGRRLGIDFDIRAEPGRRLERARPILQSTTTRRIVVIALGTNNPDESAAAAEHLVEQTLSHIHGHSVFVSCFSTNHSHRSVNNAFIAATNRRSVSVVDWAGGAARDPDRLLASDGVHLSPSGQDHWAALITNHVAALATATASDPPSTAPTS